MDKSAFKKATSSDPNPPPGFILSEMARACTASFDACADLEKAVTKKLASESDPIVIAKCLKIVKYVADNGPFDFKRIMRQHSEVMRKFTMFRGERHPMHGDALNESVRASAAEAMQAVFDDSQQPQRPQVNMASMGASSAGKSSYSSSPAQASGVYSSNAGNISPPSGQGHGYQGSASSMSSSPKQSSGSFKDRMMSRIDSIKNKVAGSQSSTHHVAGQYSSSSASSLSSQAISYADYSSSSSSYAGPSADSLISNINRQQPVSGPSIAVNVADFHVERSAVAQITAKGAVRPAPTREALDDFCRRCATLHLPAICEFLIDSLRSADWHSQVKALCAFEALALQPSLAGAVQDFFGENPDAAELLADLTASPKAMVAQRAQKVAVAVGLSDDVPQQTSGASHNQSTDSSSGLAMFDFMQSSSDGPSSSLSAPTPPSDSASTFDFLSSMTASSGSTVPTPQQQSPLADASDMFSGLQVAPSRPAAAPKTLPRRAPPAASSTQQPSTDVMDFLNYDTAGSASSASSSTTSSASSGVDLLPDVNTHQDVMSLFATGTSGNAQPVPGMNGMRSTSPPAMMSSQPHMHMMPMMSSQAQMSMMSAQAQMPMMSQAQMPMMSVPMVAMMPQGYQPMYAPYGAPSMMSAYNQGPMAQSSSPANSQSQRAVSPTSTSNARNKSVRFADELPDAFDFIKSEVQSQQQ
jgi:hypothetical protein